MENQQLEQKIKDIFLEKRGFVVQPPKNNNAILLLTGGLDSSLAGAMCIELWNTTIFPLYVKRKASAEQYELSAARKITSYLKRGYGNKAKDLFIIESEIPPHNIKKRLSKKRIEVKGYQFRNAILQSYAFQYGLILNDSGVKINTILIGSIAGSSDDYMPDSQPFTYLINSLYGCVNTEDWKWQIISPFYQEGLLKGKNKLTKTDLIAWGSINKFPFKLTRSCNRNGKLACGRCTSCKDRLKAFANNHFKDPLSYEKNYLRNN